MIDRKIIGKLKWLHENFIRNGLINKSEYNKLLLDSINNLLNNNYCDKDIKVVKSGTVGKIADGYAHFLDVPSEELEKDPWTAFRWLGDISNGLPDIRS